MDVLDRLAIDPKLGAVHAPDVFAMKPHGTTCWTTQASGDFGAGRLARTTLANKAKHLPLVHIQGDVIDRSNRALARPEYLADVVKREYRFRHWSRLPSVRA